MAMHLVDLLRRRMPLMILVQLDAAQVRHLAELLAPALGWDAARVDLEVEACKA
jgi:glycerol-3-phosphate dehydrogenase